MDLALTFVWRCNSTATHLRGVGKSIRQYGGAPNSVWGIRSAKGIMMRSLFMREVELVVWQAIESARSTARSEKKRSKTRTSDWKEEPNADAA